MSIRPDTLLARSLRRLIQAPWWLCVVVTLIQGCSKQPDLEKQHKKTKEKMEPAIDAAAIVREAKPFPVRAASNWSVPSFTKVIGFRFQEPEGHDDRDEFSLLGAVLEDKELQHCAVSGKALTNGQVDRLLAGAFTSGFVDGDAACYDPHHIFVFYAEGGRAVGAIEVCFECVRVVEWPHKGTYDDTRGHHDLSILAQLCWELGIWRGPETNLKDYYDKLSQLRKER